MGKPKKRTSPRRTGTRRSHLVLKLARAVNAKSPVKVRTTHRGTGKSTISPATAKAKTAKPPKAAAKPPAKPSKKAA